MNPLRSNVSGGLASSPFNRGSLTSGMQGFPSRKISNIRPTKDNYGDPMSSYSPSRVNRNVPRQPFPRDSRQNFNRPDRSRLSNMSQDSHNLAAMLNDGEIFPPDLLFLLSQEQFNISSFKDKIEKQKQKLENDFSNFKKEIEHIIDDLKISLQAELDNVYRFFIQKYANLKSEVQEIRRIRKEIEAQGKDHLHGSYSKGSSNKDLIRQLERDAQQYKIYRMQNYITEMQKKKLSPLLDLSRQIIVLGTTSLSYYNPDSTLKQLNELKANFSHFTKHMFGALGQYVTSPHLLLEETPMLDDVKSDHGPVDEEFQLPNRQPRKEQYEQEHRPSYQFQENYQSEQFKPYQNASMPNFRPAPSHSLPERVTVEPRTPVEPRKQFTVSKSEQIVTAPWVEEVSIRPTKTIKGDHSDVILCALFVNGKYIVTGGKDSIINVYTIDGTKVSTLKGHQAGICCLALINDPVEGTILASGSDHGCSSVILWNTNHWGSMRIKIQAHKAAVTSILDLCDGQTLVSCSYDRKINIYNYKKDSPMFHLPHKASVTSVILSSSRGKMISADLDNFLYVWTITRRADNSNIVQAIVLDKTIQNNEIIFSLNTSQLRSDVVIAGTKDGRIKFWNTTTGELEKTLIANNSAIIELVVIERESKPNFPIILSCSSKDKALVMTRTDTGLSSLFDVHDKLNIELGCGIGPKIVFDNCRWNLMMCLVSQVAEKKEINLFQVDLK